MRRLDVKIVFALLFTVLLPLGFSVYLVAKVVRSSLALGLNAEVASSFERATEMHQKYIESLKAIVRDRFLHLGDSSELAAAAAEGDTALQEALQRTLAAEPLLLEVELTTADGRTLTVAAEGPRPPQASLRTTIKQANVVYGPYQSLTATFGVKAAVFTAYEQIGAEFQTYEALVKAPPSYLETRFVAAYLAILALSLVVSVVLGILWAQRLARRIHSLAGATLRVAEGDLAVRVAPGARDEVGQLVESFNSMVGELSTSRARIEYLQKISAWQDVARRLAHEIKNPLTPIQLAAQELKSKYDGADPKFARLLSQSCEIIEEEVATLRRLTSDFSSFARLPAVKPEPIALAVFFDECRASLTAVAEQDGVALEFCAKDAEVLLLLDRIMMKRVLDNLVRNAMEALAGIAAEHPAVTVTACHAQNKRRREIEIRVADNGPGVQTEQRDSIFEPYYTTKSEGTGLGLAICKKIVLDHGGRIWLDERAEQGAAFVIVLPEA